MLFKINLLFLEFIIDISSGTCIHVLLYTSILIDTYYMLKTIVIEILNTLDCVLLYEYNVVLFTGLNKTFHH